MWNTHVSIIDTRLLKQSPFSCFQPHIMNTRNKRFQWDNPSKDHSVEWQIIFVFYRNVQRDSNWRLWSPTTFVISVCVRLPQMTYGLLPSPMLCHHPMNRLEEIDWFRFSIRRYINSPIECDSGFTFVYI